MKTKVLFIGNGFDLNLGWPTSYSSYVNSEIFEKLNVRDSALSRYLKSIQQKSNWVDIELELADYSLNRADANFLMEYSSMRDNLTEYILSVESKNEISSTSKAYKAIFDIYNSHDKLVVINFNYTNSVFKVLDCVRESKYVGLPIKDQNFKIHHVHGSADNNNIIFGVDDSHKIKEGHIEIRKSTFNDSGGKLIKEFLKSGDELHFFGFSLGETDHMYFRDFFKLLTLEEVDKNITFYHYQKQGRLGLHEQFEYLTDHKVSLMKMNAYFKFIDVAN